MKGDRIADQVPIQGNISIITKDKWYIIIKGVSEFLWKKRFQNLVYLVITGQRHQHRDDYQWNGVGLITSYI